MTELMSANRHLRWVGILLAQMVLSELLLSYIVIVILRSLGETGYGSTFMGLILGLIVFIVLTVICLNRCCFDLMDKNEYFKNAYTAYGIFIFINMLCMFVCYNETYTWAFGIYKIFNYTFLPIKKFGSAIIIHILMMLVIYIVPLWMSYLFVDSASWMDKEYGIEDIAAAVRSSTASETEKREILSLFSDDLTYDDMKELLKNEE